MPRASAIAVLTAAMFLGKNMSDAAAPDGTPGAASPLPRKIADMPEGLTSFGAAVLGDYVYLYGGHRGTAHEYSAEDQSGTLWRLNVREPGKWEPLSTGPRVQGLALVAHGDKLYRLGGFSARNKPGEKQDLWSQDDVACFDPVTRNWEQLTPLPEPRSSFDAAVIGEKVYVVGGWSLQGPDNTTWHATAWCADLTQRPLRWTPLPKPPFERRALAVAEHAGRLYVVGGMQRIGGPTTRVDLFDLEKQRWLAGPRLEGEPMEGFGAAAFSTRGTLYVTTYQGKLQRLNEKANCFVVEQTLTPARFFHRMLSLPEKELLLIGGANMGSGKITTVEAVQIAGP